MKVELEYNNDLNLMQQTLHGACNINELADLFDEMEEFQPRNGLKILADITDANLDEANYDSVSILEQRLDTFLDKYMAINKAIIAESNLEFGIARMYEMLAEKAGFNVEVFRSAPEAIQWLST